MSAMGNTTQENFERLSAERSGIIDRLDPELSKNSLNLGLIDTANLPLDTPDLQGFSRLEQLIILSIKETISTSEVDLKDPTTLFVLSSTKGNIDMLAQEQPDFNDIALGTTARKVMAYFGMCSAPVVISNACVSGVMAYVVAQRLMNTNQYRQAIVVGADLLSKFIISGFQSFNTLCEGICRPFDAERTGLNLGEAVATQLLLSTPKEGAIALVNGAVSNDANHISGPSRTGEGLKIAIEKVVENIEEIDFVYCHGTSTPYNDAMEAQALVRSNLSGVPALSTKAYTGHALGAVGVLEIILGAAALQANVLPRTLGYRSDKHGVDPLVKVSDTTLQQEQNCMLKLASGFGGSNTVALFRKGIIAEETTAQEKVQDEVLRSVKISEGKIIVDGRQVENESETAFDPFAKVIYRKYLGSYAKFHKMDRLSKLGTLAAELLLKEIDLSSYDTNEIAMIFANTSASINSDIKYQESIKEIPSPAYFVYTLPNIVIGEISIKHQLKGEGIFFIQNEHDAEALADYRQSLWQSTKTQLVLEGWLEVDEANNYCADIQLIKRTNL